MSSKCELSFTKEVKQDWKKPDMVNHPQHYQGKNGLEVFDIIEAFVPDPESFYHGSLIKYITRFHEKGGVEDLEKARVYLNKMIAIESTKED